MVVWDWGKHWTWEKLQEKNTKHLGEIEVRELNKKKRNKKITTTKICRTNWRDETKWICYNIFIFNTANTMCFFFSLRQFLSIRKMRKKREYVHWNLIAGCALVHLNAFNFTENENHSNSYSLLCLLHLGFWSEKKNDFPFMFAVFHLFPNKSLYYYYYYFHYCYYYHWYVVSFAVVIDTISISFGRIIMTQCFDTFFSTTLARLTTINFTQRQVFWSPVMCLIH